MMGKFVKVERQVSNFMAMTEAGVLVQKWQSWHKFCMILADRQNCAAGGEDSKRSCSNDQKPMLLVFHERSYLHGKCAFWNLCNQCHWVWQKILTTVLKWGLFHSCNFSTHHIWRLVWASPFPAGSGLKMPVHSWALSKRERKLVLIRKPDAVGLSGGVRS